MSWFTDDDDTACDMLYFLQGFSSPGNVFCYILSTLCDIAANVHFFGLSKSRRSTASPLVLMSCDEVIIPPFDTPLHSQAWVNSIIDLNTATYIPSFGYPLYLKIENDIRDRLFALLCCKPEYLIVTPFACKQIIRIFFTSGAWYVAIDDSIQKYDTKTKNSGKILSFVTQFQRKTNVPLSKAVRHLDRRRAWFICTTVGNGDMFHMGSCLHGNCVQPMNTPFTFASVHHLFPRRLLSCLPTLNSANIDMYVRSKYCIFNTTTMKMTYISMATSFPEQLSRSAILASLCLHAYQPTKSTDTAELLLWRRHCHERACQIDVNRVRMYQSVIQSDDYVLQPHEQYDTQRIFGYVLSLLRNTTKDDR